VTRGRSAVAGVLAVLALGYVGFCGVAFLGQRSMLYFPTPAHELAGVQELRVQSGGETVRVWVHAGDGPDALLYFGGNAEDVVENLPDFAAALPHRSLYLVNYRGYGGSTGSPSEQALFADALAAYDAVHVRHPNVAVAGRSLGSGVAVYLATQRPVGALVLVTPYDSIVNVAKGRLPFLPVGLLLRDRFDSASRVAAVKAKTLVVVAERDEVIPRERTDALVAKFPEGQARVEVVPGVTHNLLQYEQLLAGFLG